MFLRVTSENALLIVENVICNNLVKASVARGTVSQRSVLVMAFIFMCDACSRIGFTPTLLRARCSSYVLREATRSFWDAAVRVIEGRPVAEKDTTTITTIQASHRTLTLTSHPNPLQATSKLIQQS